MLGGKTVIQAEVIIRGDLTRNVPGRAAPSSTREKERKDERNTAVMIGRYCILSRGVVLKPPGKIYKGYPPTTILETSTIGILMFDSTFSHYPLKIGDHVFIGQRSVVEAALIGSNVHIAADCVIGKFVVIKDFVRILEGTVVPPNMVIPSFSVVAGRPGRVVSEVWEGSLEEFDCREIYRSVRN